MYAHHSRRGPANIDQLVAQQQQIYAASSDNRTSLWMGDIDPAYMDQEFIRNTLHHLNYPPLAVKTIRDRATGGYANYCFLEYESNDEASRTMAALNGRPIPGTNRSFRLNWASGSSITASNPGAALGLGVNMPGATGPSSSSSSMGMLAPGFNPNHSGPDFAIFVGDLGHDVTEPLLMQLFQTYYRSVKSVKVVTDPHTGLPKGYGFVRFVDPEEQQRAMIEMNGVYCGSRAMRVSAATAKSRTISVSGQPFSGMPMIGANAVAGYLPAAPQTGMQGQNNALVLANPGTSISIMPGGNIPPMGMQGAMNQSMPPAVPPGGVAPEIYQTYKSNIDNTTLFFANLAPNTSVQAISDHCSIYADVSFVHQTEEGAARGYVEVQFSTRRGAEKCSIATHGKPAAGWGPTPILVSWGKPRVASEHNSWDVDGTEALNEDWSSRETRLLLESAVDSCWPIITV